MSVTGGAIAPPVNMLDEVLALNNIQHTSGSVNFPFHVEEPYNAAGVRKKNKNTDFAYAGGKNAEICARRQEYQFDVRTQKKLAYAKIRIRPQVKIMGGFI